MIIEKNGEAKDNYGTMRAIPSYSNRRVLRYRRISDVGIEGERYMFLQQKLRFGATLMIIGSVLAAVGEILNMRATDMVHSSWYYSLGFVIVGTLILLTGFSTFASLSEQINGWGFLGYTLLLLGGFLSIIGIVAFDWILVPFLLNIATLIASTINGPSISTQNALNSVIAKLNGLGGSLRQILHGIIPHIPSVHIPLVNGIVLVNKVLTQLHLPTIEKLEWLGHFSLAGGCLTIGCLILGLALPRRGTNNTLTSGLLVIFALLNLLCQFLTSIPLYFGNLTAAALFLTLGWLGVSAWSSRRRAIPRYRRGAIDTEYSGDETLMV
jgi:predicted membrane channel-forming protein YqfA (hemolysin III family)